MSFLFSEPGTAAVQGTVPRVAIEGYVGDQMLENGGVVIDVMIPQAVPFGDAGKQRVYLPLVVR